MRAHALSITAVIVLSGCGLLTGPADLDVTFITDQLQYTRGDTARILLRNDMDRELGYNFCYSAREIRGAAGWTRIESLRLCTAHLERLAAGAEVSMEEPTAEWAPGEYRVVTTLQVLGTATRSEVFTPPFTIQ